MDSQERKARKKAWRSEQRAEARAKFPLPQEALRGLFDWLDVELGRRECDRSLRLVRAWAALNDMEPGRLTEWLNENGGFCDCEALGNVEQAFEEARGE